MTQTSQPVPAMPEELKEAIRDFRHCNTRELSAHMDMIERAYIDALSQQAAAGPVLDKSQIPTLDELRAILNSAPPAQAPVQQKIVGYRKPGPLGSEFRNSISHVMPVHRKNWIPVIDAAPEQEAQETNQYERCQHPDCGRFKDRAGWGCRAMRDGACVKDEPAATVQPVALKPKWAGAFRSFSDWTNHAQDVLKSPSHRPAVCIDAKGRRCAMGKDFMLARDEDAFPVRFFWEFEPAAAPQLQAAQTEREAEIRARALEEAATLCINWADEDVPGSVKGRSIRLATAIRALSHQPAQADGQKGGETP